MTFPEKFLFSIEKSRTSFGLWLFAFSSLIFARILIESWLFGFENQNASFLFFEWSHNFLFFLLSFVVFLPIVRYFSGVSISVASNVLLFGFIIILFPPIIDFVISNGFGFWSFYIFDGVSGLVERFFTFFGDRPDLGITYGVRVEVAIISVAFGAYVFFKNRRISRAFSASLVSYGVLFVLGTFPSWIAIPIIGFSEGRWVLLPSDIAGVFLSPFFIFSDRLVDPPSILNAKMSLVYAALLPFVIGTWLFLERKDIFLSLLRNARFPQLIYHGGLLFVGMGLAMLLSQTLVPRGIFGVLAVFLLAVSVCLSWLASVVVNDIFDTTIDSVSNITRPIPSGTVPVSLYMGIGAAWFLAALLLSGLVFPKGALLLLLYQAIAWAYSAPPFRLKRFPVLATFASAVASTLILLVGYMSLSLDGTLAGFPISLVALFLFAYTIALPLKDFKDIKGDRMDGIWTLPVILGVRRAKMIIASGILLSFLVSVMVFRIPMLLIPSVLFGSAAFWVTILMKAKTGRITYQSVLWWIISLVFLYGVSVVVAL